MTRQQAQEFINIYNTLLTISTRGEDTKTMAKVLEAMERLANTVQVVAEPIEEQIVEPTEKGE